MASERRKDRKEGANQSLKEKTSQEAPEQESGQAVDAEWLLGGYATNTLTPEEKRLLFSKALDDQALFDALADEEALRSLLADPEARKHLLAIVDPPAENSQPAPDRVRKITPLWRRPAMLGLAASLLAILSTTALFIKDPGHFSPRRQTARIAEFQSHQAKGELSEKSKTDVEAPVYAEHSKSQTPDSPASEPTPPKPSPPQALARPPIKIPPETRPSAPTPPTLPAPISPALSSQAPPAPSLQAPRHTPEMKAAEFNKLARKPGAAAPREALPRAYAGEPLKSEAQGQDIQDLHREKESTGTQAFVKAEQARSLPELSATGPVDRKVQTAKGKRTAAAPLHAVADKGGPPVLNFKREPLSGGREALSVTWARGHLYLLKRGATVQVIPLASTRQTKDLLTLTRFEFELKPGEVLDLYLLNQPVPAPETLPATDAVDGLRERIR